MARKVLSVILFLIPLLLNSQVVASFETDNPEGEYCTGDTVFFTNTSSNYSSSHWFFGDNTDTWIENPYHIYTDTGAFTVKLVVYDDNGNKDSTTKQIFVNPSPGLHLINDSGNQALIARTEIPSAFEWFYNGEASGQTDSIVYYYESGVYKVIATTDAGCKDSASLTVSLDNGTSTSGDSLTITVANNILTPDIQDGKNDVLYINGLSTFSHPCTVLIYNKAGRLVYKNEDYSNFDGFNGTDMSGKRLPAGTYYYIIRSQGRKTATGYIDIIR